MMVDNIDGWQNHHHHHHHSAGAQQNLPSVGWAAH